MRPEKFRYLLDRAIQHRLKTGSNALFYAQLRRAMHRAWERHARDENDYRTVAELNGYTFDSSEHIEGTLSYISDRWRCAFRLRWLIEGIEQGYI